MTEWAPSEVEALQASFATITTSTAADILRPKGAERLVLTDVKPLQPLSESISGPARTLRYLPARSDIQQSWSDNPRSRLIDAVKPGDILVFDTMRGLGGPVVGDKVALRAKRAGAAALVTDGLVRDVAEIEQIRLPVFAAGVRPPPAITDQDERQRQRAEGDEQIAERAMHDRKGLLPESTGVPDRVERKLQAFPNEISGGGHAEIATQAIEPPR